MLGLVFAGKKVEFKWLSDNNFQLDVKVFVNKINFEIKTGTASPFSSKMFVDNNGLKICRMHKKTTCPKNSSIENNQWS